MNWHIKKAPYRRVIYYSHRNYITFMISISILKDNIPTKQKFLLSSTQSDN